MQTSILPKKIVFIFVIGVMSMNILSAQTSSQFRKNNENIKIAIHDILGTWVSKDSAKAEIEFVIPYEGHIQIKGIKHGVGDYYFLCSKDSLNVNGTAPNWPPYDCTLNLTTKDTLEIYFYQFFYTGYTTAVYTRKPE